ncbi:MAG: transposase [Pseudomonadota bacterium]
MARALRIEYPDAWYHVTCRGNERKTIFKDDADRSKLLKILETTTHLYNVDVHAYVLMDNHIHIVLNTHEANLQRFMQRFNTAYTVYFNRRHQRIGHLYQGRYKALLIDADSYLLELSRYVHLNPGRIKKQTGLSQEEKRKIMRAYSWSSFKGYTQLRDRFPFVNYSKILGMMGSGDDGGTRRRYGSFVLSGISEDYMNNAIWEGVKGQTILGSEEFVDWVRGRYLSKKKGDRRELPGLKDLERGKSPETVKEIAGEVASHFGVREEDLYSRYTSSREARSVFMELCCQYLSRAMSLSEIGEKVGNVTVGALSHNRKRLGVRMKEDAGLRKLVEELKRTLENQSVFSTVKV